MYAIYPQDQHQKSYFDLFNVDFLNIIFVAVLASLASFLNRHAGPDGQEPRKWSWMRFFAHLTASIVSALVASNIAIYMGVGHERVLFAIAGICGWSGKEGVDWLIDAVRMKVLNSTSLNKSVIETADSYYTNKKSTHNEMNERIEVDIDEPANPGTLRKKKNLKEKPPI